MLRKRIPSHAVAPVKTTVLASALIVAATTSTIAADQDRVSFKMVVSKGASACLPNAQAQVRTKSSGDAEELSFFATGLPSNTAFRPLRDPSPNRTVWPVVVSERRPHR